MSSEPKGNEIDDLFKKAIEPVNTEPSERFWQNAAEDVISRGSKLNEKNASRWRATAFILGVGLLVLGYFSYKMENRLNTVEQQVATIKNIQNPGLNKVSTNIRENSILTKTISNPSTANKNNSTSNKKKQLVLTGSKSVTTAFIFNKQSHIDKQNKKPTDPIIYTKNDKTASDREETQVGNPTKNLSNTLPSNESSSSVQKLIGTNPKSISNGPAYVLKQPPVPINDTLKSVRLALADSNLSRFSVAAFFSPDFMAGYQFKTTDSWGSQIENAIKTGEKQSFSYTAGMKAEYALSSRFSISTGIAYQLFSFNIKPGVIYAQKQSDGDVGYYITTSSGVVDCPYYGKTKIGDSIKMSAASTRAYLEIPVQLKYNFINQKKFGIYFNVGLEANICLAEKTTMNWQDFWNKSGVAAVNETEGAESIYMSYYIGIGARYKIAKQLSLYLEPGVHEAITPLDNNTSTIITYPQLFSVTAGLTYHIK